ncbi:MAG TPA: CocE/NonD family hydrolase [Rubricoccaceae bacterium]|jgi:hypothetical protein
MRLLTAVALILTALPAHAQTSAAGPPVGDWNGALHIPGAPAPLAFSIRVAAAGDTLSSTIDIPQQGALGLPATTTTFRNDSLVVTYALFGGRLDLAVAADSLRGTFSQGPGVLPVTLGPGAIVLARPQTPVAPFPYAEEVVAVEVAPGVTLAGTFVRPAGAGPLPAVLMLSGSGAQDRDETLFGHRPFAVLADHLARQGIASMRLDDRGTGASTGNYETTTIADHTSDAAAALAALRARPGVGRVGIVGHSLGGLVAPGVAGADFVVMLAAPAVRGAALFALQNERVARASGIDSTASAALGAAIAAATQPLLDAPTAPDSVLQGRMEAGFNAGLAPIPTAARTRLGLAGGGYAERRRQTVEAMLSTELRGILLSDPAPLLAALRIPALAVYGALDAQVPADQNAPPMRAALAGRAGSEVVVLAGKNHLFQSAETGAPAEYGQIEETMSPEALRTISAWILRTAR